MATQVVVELTGGEGITINQLVSAMITPPVVGATMDLGTGVITPATAFGKADKMGINGLTAQYIMLPIRHTAPMTLTLEISADNENSTRTYTTQIPLPDGELKAGNSYLFKAVINGNSVTLASVNVKTGQMWTRQESPFIRPRIKVRFLFFQYHEILVRKICLYLPRHL